MPTAAPAARCWSRTAPPPPARRRAAWPHYKKGLLSSIPQGPDKKCHPLLGNVSLPIRISIRLKHMAGYRTQSRAERDNLFA